MKFYFLTIILIISFTIPGRGQTDFSPEKVRELVHKKIMLNSPEFDEKVELIELSEKDETVRALYINALLEKPDIVGQDIVELSQTISKGIEDKAFDSYIDKYIKNAIKETDFKLRTAYVSRSAYIPISKKVLSFQYGMLKKAIADNEIYVESAAFAATTNLFRAISRHKKYLSQSEIDFLVKAASQKILPTLRTDVYDRIQARELAEFESSALENFPFRPQTREEKEKEIEEFTQQLKEIKDTPDHSKGTVELLETNLKNLKNNLDKEDKFDKNLFSNWKENQIKSIKEKNTRMKKRFLSQYASFKARLEKLSP
jgi:hypothetical protein